MLVIPASLRSRATTCRTQWLALAWKITRADGTIYRFTDSPHAIKVREAENDAAQTYSPTEALDASARRREDELQSINKELRGVISSTLIKAADLRAGKFDGATIDEFLVDVRYSWTGYLDHSRYFVKSVAFDREVWTADVDGLTGFLDKPVGDVWQPLCRVDLFSTLCGLVATDFDNTTGVVASVQEQRRIVTLTYDVSGGNAPWNTTGYGNDGTLKWSSGPNLNIVSEIKEHVDNASGGVITLHAPTPYDIGVGATCTLFPGCNKRSGVEKDAQGKVIAGHCKDKFNNLVNFQGEPFLPGRDRALRGLPLR